MLPPPAVSPWTQDNFPKDSNDYQFCISKVHHSNLPNTAANHEGFWNEQGRVPALNQLPSAGGEWFSKACVGQGCEGSIRSRSVLSLTQLSCPRGQPLKVGTTARKGAPTPSKTQKSQDFTLLRNQHLKSKRKRQLDWQSEKPAPWAVSACAFGLVSSHVT